MIIKNKMFIVSGNVYVIYLCTGCESFDKVLQTFQAAKSNLGEILSAYEFLDTHSMVSNDSICISMFNRTQLLWNFSEICYYSIYT